ncbi:orotate phosphoribosyltransferase [bacterium]|nr:orotate phosphoribosyltransferase [bacterium]
MTLQRDDVLTMFSESGALLKGHFLLTSGMHSDTYFQCAKVFQYPENSDMLCADIADHYRTAAIDTVVSPAVGGIVFGQDLARHLKVRSIFTERVDGRMTLRRGFEIRAGEQILVAEDVTTTGGSVKEVIELVRATGGKVVGVTAVVDRSGGSIDFGVPYHSLIEMEVKNYQPEECPLCKGGDVPVKPGSRGLNRT